MEDPFPEDYKLKPKHTFRFGKELFIIDYLRKEFDKCTNPKKRRNCAYSKNLRAHVVDIREDVKINPNPTRLIEKFIMDFMKLRKDGTPSNIEQMYVKHNKIINAVKNIKSRYELSNMFVKFLKSIPILRKEIKRSDLDTETVYNMARTLYYHKHSKETLLYIQDYINPDDDRRENDISSLFWTYQVFHRFNVFSVDVYTLVRTFKTFRKTEFDIPAKPSNIIYYFGDAHSENLREYLSMLGFDTIASIKTSNKLKYKNSESDLVGYSRCLEMGKCPQPFFT